MCTVTRITVVLVAAVIGSAAVGQPQPERQAPHGRKVAPFPTKP